MKKLYFLLSLAVVVSFTSCEQFKDITVNYTKDLTWNVDVPDSTAPIVLPGLSEEVDLAGVSDLASYDKVKEITVDEIRYKYSNYTGEDVVAYAGFLKVEGSSSLSFSISNDNVKEAAMSGEEFVVPISQSDLDAINSMIANGEKLMVSVSGTLTNAPMNTDMTIILDSKAVVEVLQ